MSLPQIREQIKVILAGVSGIGVVHDYDRLAIDYNKMLNLFKDADGRINTVMFRREKMAKRTITLGQNKERIHVFVIKVIMGLNDAQATGITFDDLLAAIEKAFNPHPTLNGTCRALFSDWGPLAGVSGAQIDISEDRLFAGVLCHYGELRLPVVERNDG
jgi:hypothetical protein